MNTVSIPTEHREVITTLFKGGDKLLPQIHENDITLMHAVIGISGEAAELEQAVLPMRMAMAYKLAPTKRLHEGGLAHAPWDGYDGLPGVDIENITEELGDHLFYEGALRVAVGMEELNEDLFRTPPLWSSNLGPLARAHGGQPRKLVLCELISLHSTIAGDILDVVKKAAMYRKELDRARLEQLLVDDCWTLQAISDIIGVTEEAIRTHNVNKLYKGKNARYKHGYTDEAAQERVDKKGVEAAQ